MAEQQHKYSNLSRSAVVPPSRLIIDQELVAMNKRTRRRSSASASDDDIDDDDNSNRHEDDRHDAEAASPRRLRAMKRQRTQQQEKVDDGYQKSVGRGPAQRRRSSLPTLTSTTTTTGRQPPQRGPRRRSSTGSAASSSSSPDKRTAAQVLRPPRQLQQQQQPSRLRRRLPLVPEARLSESKLLMRSTTSPAEAAVTTIPTRDDLPITLQEWHDRMAEHLWNKAVKRTRRDPAASLTCSTTANTTDDVDNAVDGVVPYRRALELYLSVDSIEHEDWRRQLMWGSECDHDDNIDDDADVDTSPHLQRSTFDRLWRSVAENLREKLRLAQKKQGEQGIDDAAGEPVNSSATTMLTVQELSEQIRRQFDAASRVLVPDAAGGGVAPPDTTKP